MDDSSHADAKIAGTAALLVGGLAAALCLTQLITILAYSEMLVDLGGANEAAPAVAIAAVAREFIFMFAPWGLAGGILLAVAGFGIRRGSLTGRIAAQLICLASFVWIALMSMNAFHIFPALAPHFAKSALGPAFRWIWVVGGGLIHAVFGLGLLLILQRPSWFAAASTRLLTLRQNAP